MATTRKLDQSRIELSAGQSGNDAAQRAQDSRTRNFQQSANRAEGARQFDASNEQRSLDRYQRQWDQSRRDRTERDKVRADNQAKKKRTTNFGNEGADPDPLPQAQGEDPRLAEQKRQFDEKLAENKRQFDTSTDLTAASRGLQRPGEAGAPEAAGAPEQGAGAAALSAGGVAGDLAAADPRMQQMQAEMQRGQQQMGLGVESDGRRGFVPTEEAKMAGERSAGMAERELQVKEQRERTRMAELGLKHSELSAKILSGQNSARRSEYKAQQRAVEESLMQPIKSSSGRLDRFSEGKDTEKDWQALRAMVGDRDTGVPNIGMGGELHAELESKTFGPRLTSFLSENLAIKAIEFAYATGKMPDGNLVDLSSAGMQEFSKRAREARLQLLPDTVAGQMLSNQDVNKIKRSYSQHSQMVTKLAALLVLKGSPTQDPNAATTDPGQPSYEQRRADPTSAPTPAERAGQITPEGAASKYGGSFNRETGLPGLKPYQPTDDLERQGFPGIPRRTGGY